MIKLKKGFQISILIVIFIIGFNSILFAEKASYYIPPPFSYRLLCSFIVLTPISFITFLIIYCYFKFIEKKINKIHVFAIFLSMLVPLIWSCYVAASDALNDEGWNPISQAIFLTIYIPFTIPIVGRKFKLWKRIIIGIGLFLLLTMIIGVSEIPYNDFMRMTNLPTTW